MARRRRRLAALGLPRGEHRRRAETAVQSARSRARDAEMSLRTGACALALDAVVYGFRDVGRALAHVTSTGALPAAVDDRVAAQLHDLLRDVKRCYRGDERRGFVVAGHRGAKTRSKKFANLPAGIRVNWSPVHQAFFVMWHDQVLRVLPTRDDVEAYLRDLR